DFASTVTVIDATTNSVVTTIPSSGRLGLVVNPAGTRVYSGFGQSLKVIDTTTNTVIATVATPVEGIAINPAGTFVYSTGVPTFGNSQVAVVDTSTNAIVTQILVGASAEGIDVTPDGTHVYVANSGSASVSVIST